MQSAARIAVSVFLLTSALASAYRDHNGAKLRRDGILNLYPFPRVGRASHRTWQVPLNDLFIEYEPSEKRQLYAFPRVGRGDASLLRPEPHSVQLQASPIQRSESPGMWFGPRLGRALRTEDDASPIQRSESPGMWFGPRLGRALRTEDDDITIQNENSDRSEPEQLETEHIERKKRQTKLL